MVKRAAIVLSGILMSALASTADGQDMRATATSIRVDGTPMITTLVGQVVVTFPAGGVITISADTMSTNEATGETRLEGRARLTILGTELTADHAIVKRRADGAMEVRSDLMRIAHVAP